jgi:hypothetical protein
MLQVGAGCPGVQSAVLLKKERKSKNEEQTKQTDHFKITFLIRQK